MRRLLPALALCAALAAPATAVADANVTAPPINNADFELGMQAVQTKDWATARYHLEIAAAAEPANPDILNLLGYTYRNQKEYVLAFRHYREALRLDPQHKGAHEYIGEAYVLTGDKAKAREHLQALERICGQQCEEYIDLARAISRAQ
jgi:Flp pilus assembly protein TadD